MDYSLPGSSVHGIPQERILEWVAMPSSRGSSQPRDRTHVYFVSCINRWILYHWSHQESQNNSWMITQLIGGRTRIQTWALYIASVTPTYDFCSRQPAWFVSTTRVGLESESEVAQSCPTLCDPMDCSLPGSSVHGIFQARVLEWIAISFSRGSSQPRDSTPASHIVDRSFTAWATRKV